jgi:hypothetical protein
MWENGTFHLESEAENDVSVAQGSLFFSTLFSFVFKGFRAVDRIRAASP